MMSRIGVSLGLDAQRVFCAPTQTEVKMASATTPEPTRGDEITCHSPPHLDALFSFGFHFQLTFNTIDQWQ